MKYYFAPMEGLTGYVYRNAHHQFFNHIDKYFSPFIVANRSDSFKTREINDILPENNPHLILVPQILTNNAVDFIHTSKRIKQLGYHEINLNLGCPSGTVVAKNRGSGFLARTEELDAFLEEIFSAGITKISVKTRLGKDEPEEIYQLMEIFNKYPIMELIIHPRIQKDFYRNKPNDKLFREAMQLSKNPVCYNGDIFSEEDYVKRITESPEIDTVMIGRGLIMNPGMVRNIKLQKKLDKKELKDFHDKLLEDYRSTMSGDRNVLFKMKEIWFYMIEAFTDHEKFAKKIKKSERLRDYEEVIASLFREKDLNSERPMNFT